MGKRLYGGRFDIPTHKLINQSDIDYDDRFDNDDRHNNRSQSLTQLYSIVSTIRLRRTGDAIDVARVQITPNVASYHVFKEMGMYNTNVSYDKVMHRINRAMRLVSIAAEEGCIYFTAYTSDRRLTTLIEFNPDTAMFIGDVPLEHTNPDDPESIVYNMDLIINDTTIPVAREGPYTDLLPCDSGPIPDDNAEAAFAASNYILDNMNDRFTKVQSIVSSISALITNFVIVTFRDMPNFTIQEKGSYISQLRSITRFFSFVKSYTTSDGVVHTIMPVTVPIIIPGEITNQFADIINLVSISDT
jgi:hypothetical protein